jgi:hypothetical protein
MAFNQEHRVDVLVAGLEAIGVEVSYGQAMGLVDAVLAARPKQAPVRPADPHLGWIYDTHAETAALLDFLVEFYREHGEQSKMIGWQIGNRTDSIRRVFCDAQGINPDDVLRAYSALRRGQTVQYPEPRPLVDATPVVVNRLPAADDV